VEGGIYHVYTRGSNRQALFELDGDRIDFLSCLSRAVGRHELRCLGYCLMTNHYHLLLVTPGAGLSNAMKELNGRYALRFNRRHQRDAHLFKNRFGAVIQETHEQLLTTVRYIARNPLDKGLCARPEEWRWSSYRALVGLDARPSFLHAEHLLGLLADESSEATARYRVLVSG
jgi:REP element-mobilizing transposase RayT